MAEYKSLNEAMVAGDELAEAELRYQLLADAFEEHPKLRPQFNTQLERAKAEIVRLRATARPQSVGSSGTVVAFDANRFRKSS